MVTEFRFGITLNTNENLDVSYILDVLRSLDAMLKDIERNLTDKKKAQAKWEWAEDARLSFVAHVNGVDEQTLARIVGAAREGFHRVQASDDQSQVIEWPAGFGSTARRSAERILGTLEKLESLTVEATGFEPVEISEAWIGRKISGKAYRRVKASVEGVLEMVSHKGEAIIAGVREHRTRNYVRCLLTVEQWRDDLRQRNLWDRRVLVYGAVAYDHEGIPLSIRDVTEIVERDTGLNIRDFQGAAPGILGNHEVDEFISRLRGNQA